MIVTHIFGGLGNQLFQIATGVALAERLGVELRLDTRYFKRKLPVQDDLYTHHFSHGTREERPSLLPANRGDGLCRYLAAKLRPKPYTVYQETGLAYDPTFRNLGDGTYLKGYWQTEKYFCDQAPAVRAALAIITRPNATNGHMLDEINACNAVSLHIRRGDYITNAKFQKTHGNCDMDYYQSAAERIASKSGTDPVFYAFSDEPDWVRHHLKLPFEIRVVDHNGPATSYEDIRLMRNCRHHIVANSSFSWWGAWLNPDPDKIVVSPKRWFADPEMQDNDVICHDWITI